MLAGLKVIDCTGEIITEGGKVITRQRRILSRSLQSASIAIAFRNSFSSEELREFGVCQVFLTGFSGGRGFVYSMSPSLTWRERREAAGYDILWDMEVASLPF